MMKRTILVSFLTLAVLNSIAFAQGGRPAGAGVRPPNPNANVDHPSNPDKPDSTGVSKQHQPDAHTSAVDPKDTHGFKNYGQYVAAEHVAENLNIPGGVDALKTLMTGDNAVSLGKAIKQLRPDLTTPVVTAEVKKAEAAAKKAEAEAKKGAKPTD